MCVTFLGQMTSLNFNRVFVLLFVTVSELNRSVVLGYAMAALYQMVTIYVKQNNGMKLWWWRYCCLALALVQVQTSRGKICCSNNNGMTNATCLINNLLLFSYYSSSLDGNNALLWFHVCESTWYPVTTVLNLTPENCVAQETNGDCSSTQLKPLHLRYMTWCLCRWLIPRAISCAISWDESEVNNTQILYQLG